MSRPGVIGYSPPAEDDESEGEVEEGVDEDPGRLLVAGRRRKGITPVWTANRSFTPNSPSLDRIFSLRSEPTPAAAASESVVEGKMGTVWVEEMIVAVVKA
jgi:hypothetical protein